MTVLIVGSASDAHVQSVAGELRRSRFEHAIIDPYDAGANGLQLDAADGIRWALGQSSGVVAAAVKAVWWRFKPPFVIRNESLADYYDASFATMEQSHALAALPMLLPAARWVNDPGKSRTAAGKVAQLLAAKALGLRVPSTLVTNSADELRRFMATLSPARCVHKTFTPYVAPDGRQCFTNIIDEAELDAMADAVGACAAIYQVCIRPEYELRITVIGETLFPASIRKADRSVPDWRRSYETNQTRVCEISGAMREGILALQAHFGLSFACYDFVVDEDGAAHFLELNPAGQWLWIEDETGQPISASLAAHLAGSPGV